MTKNMRIGFYISKPIDLLMAERFVALLLALTSLGSYNRSISDFAIAPSKFLASLGTSDMPWTLAAIAKGGN